MFPVTQEGPRQRLIEALQVQFEDNQKARELLPDGTYRRVAAEGTEPVRAQERLYRLLLAEHDRVRSIPPVRFVPLKRKD